MANKANTLLQELRKQTLFGAIAMLVMGILLLLGTLSIICKALGIVMLAVGVVYIMLYFINLFHKARVSSQIVLGISLLLLGLIFYYKSGVLTSLLNLFFAVALALDGAVKLDKAVSLFRGRCSSAWLVLLFALAALTVSVLIVFSVLSGTTVIGIILLIAGVLDLLTLLFMARGSRAVR